MDLSSPSVTSVLRQSEVGMVPSDWQVVPLGSIMDFRNGVNADKAAYGSGVPFINVLEVITKPHLHLSDVPGRVALSRTTIDSYAVRRGDVLFNRTSETLEEVGLASVFLDDSQVVFGGFVIRGRPVANALDPTYCGYGLRHPAVRSQLIARGQGAIRANIGQADMRQVLVPLPPLPEQRAIATALSDVDGLLAGLDALIAKKKALKQGAMQQLLTGKQRLPGFTGEWMVRTFGELVTHHAGNSTLIKGKLPSSPFVGSYAGFSASGQDVWLESYEHEGDAIVVSAVGSRCGRSFRATGKWSAIANTHVVWPKKDRVDIRYLSLYINDENFWLKSGSGQPFVLVRQSFAREIPLPPIQEQTAIAEVLSDMDAELGALEARRAKTALLKQGMMQELLTGRTRLV